MRAACPKDKLEYQFLQALLFVRKFIKLQVFPCVRSPARPRKTRFKAQPTGQGHGWPWDKKVHRKKKKEKELAEAEISRLAWPGQKRTKAWTESKVDLGHFPIIAPAKRLKIWSKWYQ